MPFNSISLNTLKDPQMKAAVTEAANVAEINGQFYSRAAGADAYRIIKLNQRLSRSGMMNISNSAIGTQQMASDILKVVAISPTIHANRNNIGFSLIHSQLDTETIDNPNILNPSQYTNIQKRLQPLTPMFSNPNDPIYVLDDAMVDAKQVQLDSLMEASKTPNTAPLVLGLMNIIADPNQPTLKNLRKFGGK